MKLIEDCICQESESLARIAIKVYNDLIISIGRDFQGNKIDLRSDTADIICERICKCVTQNLCIDYGDIGVVDFVEDTPSLIVELVPECPITNRRNAKEDTDPTNSFDERLQTPYGVGDFVETIDMSTELQLPKRWAVSLSWGATLYTTDPMLSGKQAKDQKTASRQSTEAFKKVSTSAMTSMVITLDLIKVITDAIETHYLIWKLENLLLFLNALELMFWHARSFNENFSLRSRLWRRSFMRFAHDSNALPHLLEQEIQTISLIQFIIIKLYHSNGETGKQQAKNFAEPWIQR